MWYILEAYNQPMYFGWTDNADVAEAALTALNRGRDINLYSLHPATPEDVDEHNFDNRDDFYFCQDTSVSDFEDDE